MGGEMEHEYRQPVYSMGIVVNFLKVCPATLRIWEKRGLVSPARLGKNRFYSKSDLDRLVLIKDMIQKKRINIEGIKNILNSSHCWEVKKCSPKTRNACPVYQDKPKGRILRE
jgi:MerR family transcriptional regulator, heat shock protein HspR